jgi:hypothetical protein
MAQKTSNNFFQITTDGWPTMEKSIFSCANCNAVLRDSYFPVEGHRAAVGTPYKEVLKEKNFNY